MAGSSGLFSEDLFRYTFEDIAPAFQSLHKDPINVGIHMLTTPLGMIGAMSLIRSYSNSSTTNAFIFFCYLVSLLPALTTGVYICTAMTCFVIFYLTKMLKLSTPVSVAMIAISYALQDLVHAGKTSYSFYMDNSNFKTVSTLWRVICPFSQLHKTNKASLFSPCLFISWNASN